MKTTLLIIALMIIAPDRTNFGKTGTRNSNKLEGIHDLKILTWNIYMLPHCSWIHGNCSRARVIAEQLKSSPYDIIVFEEAFDYKARKIIRRQLQELYPFIYGPANESFFSIRTNSGIWILSKVPLKKLKEIEYKNRFGIDAMARKGAVMFEGEWNGRLFQLVGTHLQADSPDEVRREQCNEISNLLLKQFSKENVPQIVCGDFNIEMEDALNYHYMLNALDAENGLMEGDIHTSFDEIDNQLAKKQNGKKQLIDYVLVRNSRWVKNIRRRISVIRAYHDNILMELSDHYGVEATFNFEPSTLVGALPYLTKQ
jgi:sphingomyelin phosphodiesterase